MLHIKIWVQAVWGTKNRQLCLNRLCQNKFATILKQKRKKDIFIDRINGYDEHVHVLMLLKYDLSISKQMQLLKGESSFWANNNGVLKNKLEWADKYFAASVSNDKVDFVRKYIDNQQTHHQKMTFIEEYNIFIKSLGYGEYFG